MKISTQYMVSSSLLIILSFLLFPLQFCSAKDAPKIPTQLEPWVDWVLHGQEKQILCIPHYNDPNSLECNWPTELKVMLDLKGGEFSQSWQVNHESLVSVPGNDRLWPQEVKVDGKPIVVIQEHNKPKIQLQPGSHIVTGKFFWNRLPEYLQISPRSALVSLSLNNERVDFPSIDESGRLWLKTAHKEQKIEDRLKVEAYRLIDDGIPPRLYVHITLDVSGSARQITLGPVCSPGNFIPLSLQSPLPAKLEPDGKMRIQVRPGRYTMTLSFRHVDPLQKLAFNHPNDNFWPQQEIWSFCARTSLRMVEIEGAPSVDPLQTAMPQAWQKYPAYRLLPGEALQFKEIKRGDPHPAPDQLNLNRSLWLRFDGSGYTIQDNISGKKNTNWRLEMDPSINLGKVTVDGVEQFITQRQGSERSGIELRKGILNLSADSIYQGNISALPAAGWDHDFQKIQGRLHLPPGWKLLNARGIDNIPHTWIKRWTLLDFFIVLIFTIAVGKLFSKPLSVVAFITLVLIYHEPGAPRYVWLALLIGFALLKHLPSGKFKQVVRIYQVLIFLILVITAIPYAIHALRIGIYPQLARPWASMTEDSLTKVLPPAAPGQMDVDEQILMEQSVSKRAAGIIQDKERKLEAQSQTIAPDAGLSRYRSQVMQYDPKALTQTGPGLPKWQPFETINFSWSGPVTRDQKVSFTLIGPRINLVLSFLRVFLIVLLVLGMFGIRYRRGQGFYFPGLKSFYMILLLILISFSPGTLQAQEIPSPQILDELQRRLLEKDACFPGCADISDIHISVHPENITIVAAVNAQVDTVIPIPSHIHHWLPQQVLVNDSLAKGLFRKDNGLWALIPAGKHSLKLNGRIRKLNTFQLPFPLKPHRATVEAKGWSVEGIHPDGTCDSQLQFKRIVEQENKHTEILETGILPPFARIERNILLGLDWKVETKVQRISPTGSAMVLNIPLLPGESVITEGVRVNKGIAQINLQADQTYFRWGSFLEHSRFIHLRHPQTDDWTEIWKVDVSPIFHMESEGIPVILHKSGNRWYPTWHPWPGEEIKLNISRPSGIPGRTMTIEKSHLELRPGQRTTNALLILSIKSSQGGQHTISLPSNAELQEVKIGGRVQPIRQEGKDVPLPITPGEQNIELKWRESSGIVPHYKTPDIDLGAQSVNAGVDIYLPYSRWPLFVGGEQLVGPAVLFWSVLLVVVLVAFGLSKTQLTPLKFYHWFLLGIGMAMSNPAACIFVTGWLIAVDYRKKAETFKRRTFNALQIGIGFLTILAMGSLVFAVSQGLLGHPDMNIVGNGSSRGLLRWYQDVSDPTLPHAWVFSIPMAAYRVMMLIWALWISFWLVGILKWAWGRFTEPGIWRSAPPKLGDLQKGNQKT